MVSYTNQPPAFPYGTNGSRNGVRNIAIDRCCRTLLWNWQHDALQPRPNTVEVSMVTSACLLQRCCCTGCEAIRKSRNCWPMDASPIVCCCWTCWRVHAAIRCSAASWHCGSPSMWDSRRTWIRDW